MKITRMNREDTVLVMVDFQERLMPAMRSSEKVIMRAAMLATGFKEFGIPALVTQQYTKGMGETVEPVAKALGEFTPIEKKEFSCMKNAAFKAALEETGKKTVVVAGCETHVCVQQTVRDLLAEDYTVYVVQDCASSRKRYMKEAAIVRMREAGAIITNAETALFELLVTADDPSFRTISKLVK
ncbi:MAG: isochorismatase family protein [Firmicutes bacterium]|nr:isochorismatase family protein [Bacillota bacterium]